MSFKFYNPNHFYAPKRVQTEQDDTSVNASLRDMVLPPDYAETMIGFKPTGSVVQGAAEKTPALLQALLKGETLFNFGAGRLTKDVHVIPNGMVCRGDSDIALHSFLNDTLLEWHYRTQARLAALGEGDMDTYFVPIAALRAFLLQHAPHAGCIERVEATDFEQIAADIREHWNVVRLAQLQIKA